MLLLCTPRTVASGIGITPTLSLIEAYQETKRVNVVWVCRDPGLVEYVLQKVDLRAITKYSFVLIFYTGERDLVLPRYLPANFFLFRTRPNLERTVAGIVACVESGNDLPEEMYTLQEEISDISFERRVKIGLAKIASAYSRDELFDYAVEKTQEKQNRTHGHDRKIPRPPTSSTGSYVSARSGDSAFSEVDDLRGSERYVSRQGFEDMILSLLDGIGDYTREDIDTLFKSVAAGGSQRIWEEDFNQFFDLNLGEEDEEILDKVERGLSRSATMTSLSGRDKLALHALDRRMSLSSSCRSLSQNLRDTPDLQVPAVIDDGAATSSLGAEVDQGADADPSINIRAEWVEGFARLKGGEDEDEDEERPKGKSKKLSKVERGLCRGSSLADVATLPSGSVHSTRSTKWATESIADSSTVSVGTTAFGGDDAIEFLKVLAQDKDRPLKSWGIFYCGASAPIEKTLKKIEKKYGISLSIEKFEW